MDHWEALQFKLALSPRGKKHDLKDLVGHNCKVSLSQVVLIFSSLLGKYFVCRVTALAGRDLALVRPKRRNGRQNPFHIGDHESMMVNGSRHIYKSLVEQKPISFFVKN